MKFKVKDNINVILSDNAEYYNKLGKKARQQISQSKLILECLENISKEFDQIQCYLIDDVAKIFYQKTGTNNAGAISISFKKLCPFAKNIIIENFNL